MDENSHKNKNLRLEKNHKKFSWGERGGGCGGGGGSFPGGNFSGGGHFSRGHFS